MYDRDIDAIVRHSLKRRANLILGPNIDDDKLHTQGGGDLVRVPSLDRASDRSHVDWHTDFLGPWKQLYGNLELLAQQRIERDQYPGQVAPRTGMAHNQSLLYGLN